MQKSHSLLRSGPKFLVFHPPLTDGFRTLPLMLNVRVDVEMSLKAYPRKFYFPCCIADKLLAEGVSLWIEQQAFGKIKSLQLSAVTKMNFVCSISANESVDQ